jgi:hypothetical protein
MACYSLGTTTHLKHVRNIKSYTRDMVAVWKVTPRGGPRPSGYHRTPTVSLV